MQRNYPSFLCQNLLSKSSELGHKIELKQANSLANEAQWIFQNIVNLLPLIKTPTQIAILVRQNNYLQNLTLHLNYLANIYNQKIKKLLSISFK